MPVNSNEEFKRVESVLKHHASGRHHSDSIHLDHHKHEDHGHLDSGHHETAGKHDEDVKSGVNASEILDKAMKQALGGGLAGAAAMFTQVGALMWMRTTMNYQYRNGHNHECAENTFAEGGVGRFTAA